MTISSLRHSLFTVKWLCKICPIPFHTIRPPPSRPKDAGWRSSPPRRYVLQVSYLHSDHPDSQCQCHTAASACFCSTDTRKKLHVPPFRYDPVLYSEKRRYQKKHLPCALQCNALRGHLHHTAVTFIFHHAEQKPVDLARFRRGVFTVSLLLPS